MALEIVVASVITLVVVSAAAYSTVLARKVSKDLQTKTSEDNKRLQQIVADINYNDEYIYKKQKEQSDSVQRSQKSIEAELRKKQDSLGRDMTVSQQRLASQLNNNQSLLMNQINTRQNQLSNDVNQRSTQLQNQLNSQLKQIGNQVDSVGKQMNTIQTRTATLERDMRTIGTTMQQTLSKVQGYVSSSNIPASVPVKTATTKSLLPVLPVLPVQPAAQSTASSGMVQGPLTVTADTNMNANANVRGDIVFNGGNNWIMETADNGTRNLRIAPSTAYGNKTWNWGNAMVLEPSGDVTVQGTLRQRSDTVRQGGNNWIMHTPNDGRRNMWIAPSTGYNNQNWAWDNGLRIDPDGTINAKKICLGTKCMTANEVPSVGGTATPATAAAAGPGARVVNGKYAPEKWNYNIFGVGIHAYLPVYSMTFNAPVDGYMIITWAGHTSSPIPTYGAYYTILVNNLNPLDSPDMQDVNKRTPNNNALTGNPYTNVPRDNVSLNVTVHVKVKKGTQTLTPSVALPTRQVVSINGSGMQYTFIPAVTNGSTVQTVDLPLRNSWRAAGGEYGKPNVSRMGDIVIVDGAIVGNFRDILLAVLPEGMRPSKRLAFSVNNHDGQCRVDVKPNGDIIWVAGTRNGGALSLSGITFKAA